MDLQHVVVALIVPACALYALWALIGVQARRHLAEALLRLALPQTLGRWLRQAAGVGNACGCDGCDRSSAPKRSTDEAPVIIVRRR